MTTHFLRGELQRISINSHNIVSFQENRTRIPATAIGRTRRRCSRSACPPRHSDLKLIRLQFIPDPSPGMQADGSHKGLLPFQPCVGSFSHDLGVLWQMEGSSFHAASVTDEITSGRLEISHFCIHSKAPASNAAARMSSPSYSVTTMILADGSYFRICLVAVKPSMRGIRMSISTMSGR